MNGAELHSLGYPQLASLVKHGFTVNRLSEFHFRIVDRFDVFTNAKGRAWKYHDIALDVRGLVEQPKVSPFIERYLKENPPPASFNDGTVKSSSGFLSDSRSGPEPATFKEKFEALYVADAPWDAIWKLVSDELEATRNESRSRNPA